MAGMLVAGGSPWWSQNMISQRSDGGFNKKKSFGDPFSFRVCVRSELCTSSPDVVLTLLVIQWAAAGEVLCRVMPWLPEDYPA
jgi:hypothetical protein